MGEQLIQQRTTAAAGLCLAMINALVSEAASLARAAASCVEDGSTVAGLHIALDVEPMLTEANTLSQAAAILRRAES